MPPSPAPLDVLVVDDDPSSRAAVARAVGSLGHACRAASSGEAAWALLVERPSDVVISDWRMPGLDGLALCARARATSDDGPYTYFILMTGNEDRGSLRAAMEAGADDFQAKPIDLDELEARLLAASRVVALHRRLAERTEGLRRDSKTFFREARTDALTGVGNRCRLDEELAAARSKAVRYGHRYTLAICDVDEFKRYNDAFGHPAGDHALVRVAETLRRELRTSDSLFRYGGEEFVVLLPEQSADDGVVVLDRIRLAVANAGILAPSSKPLTISAGVAELVPSSDTNVETWLGRADAALYRAKAAGRNRIARAEFPMPRSGVAREGGVSPAVGAQAATRHAACSK
jgi:two-component system chemotaxis response regulator CheY